MPGDGPGGPGAAGEGAATGSDAPSGDETSDEGFGFTGQQGFGPSPGPGGGFGFNPEDDPTAELAQTSRASTEQSEFGASVKTTPELNIRAQIGKAQRAAAKSAQLALTQELDPKFVTSLTLGKLSTIKNEPFDPFSKTEPDINIKTDTRETESNLLSLGKVALGVITAANPVLGLFTGALSETASRGLSAAAKAGRSTEARGLSSASTVGFDAPAPDVDAEVSTSTEADSPSDSPEDSGGEDLRRRRAVSSRTSGVTLAIAEPEDEFSSKELRRARRQITRFA